MKKLKTKGGCPFFANRKEKEHAGAGLRIIFPKAVEREHPYLFFSLSLSLYGIYLNVFVHGQLFHSSLYAIIDGVIILRAHSS
jgi:hypothetical protein